VSLGIRLLGRPELTREGRPVAPPRGGKSWGLLAYLLLADRPASRRELAELLFPDAGDPLGALRWSLAQLRAALGVREGLRGDPPSLELPPGTEVDVRVLASGTRPEESSLRRLGGELLEGLPFDSCPAFASWLAVQRRHLAGAAEALLHEAALAELAAGRTEAAVRLASDVVALNPLDEGHHELLVRSLARGGDRAAAIAQAERCDELFRRELGVAPSAAVRRAAYESEPSATSPLSLGRTAALGQLEAGEAAAAAGAVDSAVERLRRAATEAARSGDDALRARALVALGTTLVHTVRGRDEEGAAVLHQAIAVAERAGARGLSAAAHRELGYIDVQAGRRERAEVWLTAAEELARGDAELAAVLGFQGMNESDMGRYGPALARLSESVERAQAAGDRRQAAWSLSLVGRVHLLRGDDAAAEDAMDRCLEWVDAEGWLAFRPWPEALRAEVHSRAGRVADAAGQLEHAFAVACQVDDPCWEAVSARGIGLLEVGQGRAEAGQTWLEEALSRCTRVVDRYEWAYGYVLEALTGAAVRTGDPAARAHAEHLLAVAARSGMSELVVRAQVHLGRLGEPGALDSARLLAQEIDNPLLDEVLSAAPG
jgi:DNA-binding SARP family transcriptional activator